MKLLGKRQPIIETPRPTIIERIERTVEELPWFGEEPFLASLEKRTPHRAMYDVPFIRRVLISWLIGRPVSSVARRAGCSPRLVHKIINNWFYSEPLVMNWHFEQWFDLGLIAAIATPEDELGVVDGADPPSWFKPGEMTIACLVCHRLLGSLPHRDLEHSGIWMQDVSSLLENLWFAEEREQKHGAVVQGHLMCHFELEYNPIKPKNRQTRIRTLALKAALGNANKSEIRSLRALEATRTRTFYRDVHHMATYIQDEFLAGDAGPLLPVRNGKQMGLEQARRWWRGMI